MRFAVIADIHGNSAALSAVLADMATCGVTEAVNLGDHFSGPLDARGTADLLMQQTFVSIRGNHDRWLVEKDPQDMGPSDRVAYDQLDPHHLQWLADLPATRRMEGVFLCHATPSDDLTYWLERVRPDGQMRRATRPEVEAEAQGIDASLILCGHTHIPRSVRLEDGRHIVNPGSVGCPAYDDDQPVFHVMQTGTPDASYAIVESTANGWDITFRQVPYDASAMIALALSHGRSEWARALATGWIEPV